MMATIARTPAPCAAWRGMALVRMAVEAAMVAIVGDSRLLTETLVKHKSGRLARQAVARDMTAGAKVSMSYDESLCAGVPLSQFTLHLVLLNTSIFSQFCSFIEHKSN